MRRALILLCLPFLSTRPAHAQWIYDGTPVVTVAESQEAPRIVPDGLGGVIVIWHDRRNGANWDLYAQRFDSFGIALWTPQGIVVSDAAGDQTLPDIVADGTGGFYVAWQDTRSGNIDIYAQHFDATGSETWAGGGEPVCTDPAEQGGFNTGGPRIVRSDAPVRSDLGIIVAWNDNRGGGWDIYAQRVSNTGAKWTANGILVCGAANAQFKVRVARDGNQGAILAWEDDRLGTIIENNIYAQRVDIDGVAQWTTDGVSVCNAAWDQTNPEIVSDNAGGCYVAWNDRRGGVFSGIGVFVQRIDGAGAPVWAVNGISVYGVVEAELPRLVADDAGGCIVAWRDQRLGNIDIFAQRLDGAGGILWAPFGVAICTTAGTQANHAIAGDGDSGAWIVWDSGSPVETHVQRIAHNGAVVFGGGGALVSGAPSHQRVPAVCVRNKTSAYAAWIDFRSGNNDVYVTPFWATLTGVGETPAPRALDITVSPNPFTRFTEIRLPLDGVVSGRVLVYDVAGRLVAEVHVSGGSNGVGVFRFDGRDGNGNALPSGVYLVRGEANGRVAAAKMVLVR